MRAAHTLRRSLLLALGISLVAVSGFAQTATFKPEVGQAGKDVVWVPTPQALVDKMLDMAKVTPQDYVIDLGSGDGRTVITAAKRGATAKGIEYNPEMVALSQRNAATEGVTAKATFEKADLFESDFSKATVITMFLLPDINLRLRPEDPRPQAGNPHRVQHVHDGRLATRRRGDGRPGLHDVVQGAVLDRARQGRGNLAASAGRDAADAEVSDGVTERSRTGTSPPRLPTAGCAAMRSPSPPGARPTPAASRATRWQERHRRERPGARRGPDNHRRARRERRVGFSPRAQRSLRLT